MSYLAWLKKAESFSNILISYFNGTWVWNLVYKKDTLDIANNSSQTYQGENRLLIICMFLNEQITDRFYPSIRWQMYYGRPTTFWVSKFALQ